MITWFKDNFGKTEMEAAASCGIVAEEILELEAKRIPAGSQGLVLQPYWLGVRQPYWDENARGVIIGWTGNHTKAHLYRAIIEGIAYDIRLNFDGMEEALESTITNIRIYGGGAKSELSCQIVADVTNRPVSTVHTEEATTLGAAIHAATANKDYKDIKEAANSMVHIAREYKPNKKNSRTYERYYKNVYVDLYSSNMKLMKKISNF
jgi:xylulokinase